MTTKNEKKRIILSNEQRQKMADESAAYHQRFTGELNMVQSRRFEAALTLLGASVTKNGAAATTEADVEKCRALADQLVHSDAVQKWNGFRAMVVDLSMEGPQPHLEWAARQVGVELFPPESPILSPTIITSEGESIQ